MHIYNIKINGSKAFKIIGTLISLIVICLLIFSIYKIINLAKFEGYETSKHSDITEISVDNYTNILKTVHENLDSYIGKKVSFSGYIYRVFDFDENQFVLARDMIISSDLQTVVVGFLCESKDSQNFQDGTWVNITGEITKGNYHGDIPLIKVTKIEECSNPDKQSVYPPDDNYLQTTDI